MPDAPANTSPATPPTPAQPPKKKPPELEPFHLEKVFPDLPAVLGYVAPPLTAQKDDALFVFDTNTMLRPFDFDRSGFADIERILRMLAAEDRLYVPAQAVREFARNRGRVMANVLKKIPDYGDSFNDVEDNLKPIFLPVLDNLERYKSTVAAHGEVTAARANYLQKLRELRAQVSDYAWDDQVSRLYRELLPDRIVHHGLSTDDVMKQLEHRYKHRQPPGWADEAKPDKGVGDLIIWLTILKLGKDKSKDVIFVSDERKPDWIEQVGTSVVVPKFELVTEYHGSTQHHFTIINFARFLALFEADERTVSEAAFVFRNAKYGVSVTYIEHVSRIVGNIHDALSHLIKQIDDKDFQSTLLFDPESRRLEYAVKELDLAMSLKVDKGDALSALAELANRLANVVLLNESIAKEHVDFTDASRKQLRTMYQSVMSACKSWLLQFGP